MYITKPNLRKIIEQVKIDDTAIDIHKVLEDISELDSLELKCTEFIKDILSNDEVKFFNQVHFLYLHMLDNTLPIEPIEPEPDKFIQVYESDYKLPAYHYYDDCERLGEGVIKELPVGVKGKPALAEKYRAICKEFDAKKPLGEDKELLEQWENDFKKALEKEFSDRKGVHVQLPVERQKKESELFDFKIEDIADAYTRLIELCSKLKRIKDVYPKIYQMRYSSVEKLYTTLPKSFYGSELSETQKETRTCQIEFANIKEELIILLVMYKAMKLNLSAEDLQLETLEKFNFQPCQVCLRRYNKSKPLVLPKRL